MVEPDPAFVVRVMRAFPDGEPELWWRKSPVLMLFVNCSDAFAWGCADLEQVTPDNVDVLERSVEEAGMDGALLFCARVRRMRPQGAMYKHIAEERWPLFDACGPERATGLGNPLTPEEAIKRG